MYSYHYQELMILSGRYEMKMLRRYIAITLLLLHILVLTAADPGPKSGFRKLKWGDRPSQEMRRAAFADKGHMQSYYINQEDPIVAGEKSGQIYYYFRRERLCRVDVAWLSQGSVLAVITATLNREWGRPDKSQVYKTFISYEWLSRDGKTAAYLSWIENPTNDDATLDMWIEDKKCVDEAVNDPGL